MRKFLKSIARIGALLSAGLGFLHFYRIHTARGMLLEMPKLLAAALSPFLALVGLASAVLARWVRAPLALLLGGAGAALSARYLAGVLAPQRVRFDRAFGVGWEARIPRAQRARMLPRRWQAGLPEGPEPQVERDVPFWTIAPSEEGEEERSLLCDLWLPPDQVTQTRLAFIYFHGSAWHFGDKDAGTRPMFRHLARQGHVVMDVAYRLCPEVEWRDMAGDPKRAIVWMKANAATYGVDPERIVLGGGSAGGQLALLTAYTPYDAQLIPEDVLAFGPEGADLSVRGVVSWYGPADLRAPRSPATQTLSIPVGDADTPGFRRMLQRMARLGMPGMRCPGKWRSDQTMGEAIMCCLLGGTAEEVPEAYREFSPAAHVGPDCPPTLLLQGEHDMLVSSEGVRELARALEAAGVPVVHIEYPQTDHAFDLVLPQVSPVAQAALYEVDRFLGLMAQPPERTCGQQGPASGAES